jgi:hypothetical protein
MRALIVWVWVFLILLRLQLKVESTLTYQVSTISNQVNEYDVKLYSTESILIFLVGYFGQLFMWE